MKLKKMMNWYMIVYLYLDFNNKIIHQEFHIKKRIPKNLGKNKEQIVNLNVEDCTVNEKRNIIKRTTKKEGFETFKCSVYKFSKVFFHFQVKSL